MNVPNVSIRYVFILIATILLLTLRGALGSGIEQAEAQAKPGGALESSISRGRYALVLSLADEMTLTLSTRLAAFAYPDVSSMGSKVLSIFPPGVAFLALPWYLLGRAFGVGQLAVSVFIAAIALLNVWLIYTLGIKCRLHRTVSLYLGTIFLFGTNAFAYSTVLSQHQISTMLLLLALHSIFLRSIRRRYFVLICLSVLAPLIDWPNIVLLAPIIGYAWLKDVRKIGFGVFFRNLWVLSIPLAIFLVAYGVYNMKTSGSPFVIGQTLLPFDLQHLPRGLRVLLMSTERGVLYFAPIMVLSLLGIIGLVKRIGNLAWILLSVFVLSLIVYGSFGDEWGGPSFGPRYLIPGFAMVSFFLGSAFEDYAKHTLIAFLFALLAGISVAVNSLGAISTILVPGHEAFVLGQRVSVLVSADFLVKGEIGSFFYNSLFIHMLSPVGYYGFVLSLTTVLICLLFTTAYRQVGSGRHRYV